MVKRLRVRRAEDTLEVLLAEGAIAGYQMQLFTANDYVACHGGRASLHAPMRSDTLMPLACAVKPVLALAVATLVEDRSLALSARLGALLPEFRDSPIGGVTVEQLLSHSVGLQREPRVAGTSTVQSVLGEIAQWTDDVPANVPPTYSEALNWYILAGVVAAITRVEPQISVLRLLETLRLNDIIVDASQLTAARRNRVGTILVQHRPGSFLEYSGLSFSDGRAGYNPAFGGVGSMRAMASIYRCIVDALLGRSSVLPLRTDTVRMFTAPPRVPTPYRLGFEGGLQAIGLLPRFSSNRAFGHCATIARGRFLLGFADPDADLAGAVVLNGVDPGSRFRLLSVTTAVYRDLGINERSPDTPNGKC
ncbi:MAG: serine hydrolase domain-containing protein [Gammaproteobacteria bacterium]